MGSSNYARHVTPPADDREQTMDAIYAKLPTMTCKGLCQAGCHSVGMNRVEQARIEREHQIRLPLMAAFGADTCPALNVSGRCSVYQHRPLVCQLWGMVPSMRCPHGCEPDGGMLTEQEGRLLLADSYDVDNRHDLATKIRKDAGPR